MKVKAVPTGLVEHVLAFGHRLPVPIAETAGAMMLARTVESACVLGIFTHLSRRGPLTPAALCAELSLDDGIGGALLLALAGAGYVIEKAGTYKNGAVAERFLVEGGPNYVGNFIRYNRQQRLLWMGLEHMARGRGERRTVNDALRALNDEISAQLPPAGEHEANSHHAIKDPRVWHDYMHGLRDLSNLTLPELQLRLRLPRGARRLLDVGGGHGAYSMWMCRRYPALTSTVVDLESAAAVGREIVAREGLSRRIQYVSADATALERFEGGPYDVAFCFNLIHHVTRDQGKDLLRKIGRALAPGGTLVLWDAFRDDELRRDSFARFVGLMFLLASGGDTYSFDEVTAWMDDAGFDRLKRIPMRSTPGTAIIQGRRR